MKQFRPTGHSTQGLRAAALLLPALLAAILAPGARAQGPEVIQLFRSDIRVAPDASVSVHETIRVRAAGAAIQRGIFRDFPTRYRNRFGNQVRVGFTVQQVLRDGRPEPYRLESIDNGVRIRIGRADVRLSPGEYTYEIFYETSRQLGFFDDHDELYWNATGNDWAFPIERAEARVQLPAGISMDAIRVEGYTGLAGAKDQEYRARVADDGAAEFETTQLLGRREGLTIVVGWPKGFVTAPTAEEELRYFFADNRTAFVAGAGLIVLLAYYLLVWSSVGRDPAPGSIMVRYEPPPGLSPAGMRFLTRMGFDQTAFVVATVSLAVKRYLTIRHDGKFYTLVRNSGASSALTPEEKALAKSLLDSRSQIMLTQDNHKEVRAASNATKQALKLAQEKIYFFTNSRYLLPGLGLSALTMLAAMLSLPGGQLAVSAFMSVWLTGWSVGVFALTVAVFAAWRSVAAERSVKSLTAAGFLTLFSVPFWAGEIFGLTMLIRDGSMWFAVLLFALVGTNILFHYLLKAPTLAGRALLDQVEGFKQYFLAVEKNPMERLGRRELAPEVFEKYLPYAMALGVEKAWSNAFASALAQAEQAPHYSPAWYHGPSLGTLGAPGFAGSLGSALSSAVASASTSPGSSSGGGGGGSSGGGGGGGGGGGW
jgi:uncharacterized membrane protein YgcG